MPDHAVDAEDALYFRQEGEVADRRAELFVGLGQDGVTVTPTEFDATSNEAVVAIRVLAGRGVDADSVAERSRDGATSMAFTRMKDLSISTH